MNAAPLGRSGSGLPSTGLPCGSSALDRCVRLSEKRLQQQATSTSVLPPRLTSCPAQTIRKFCDALSPFFNCRGRRCLHLTGAGLRLATSKSSHKGSGCPKIPKDLFDTSCHEICVVQSSSPKRSCCPKVSSYQILLEISCHETYRGRRRLRLNGAGLRLANLLIKDPVAQRFQKIVRYILP